MTIQEMQKRKRELGYTYAEIAKRSGLPLPTVQKVLGGTTKSPRYDTILALENVLAPVPDAPSRDPEAGFEPDPPGICGDNGYRSPASAFRDILAGENAPAYLSRGSSDGGRTAVSRRLPASHPLLPHKRQGEYTREDRELLPEDARTELIDGILYDMASPKAAHQITLMELSYQLRSQIDQCGKDCMVLIAPSDVWLTYDDRNVFQPDIYVLCDYSMIDMDGYTKGAPPFVIEILSPSTRSRDLLLKSYKYHAAGVHEYWIVDPEKKQVIVYDYDRDPDGTESTVHRFEETVPVAFSGGSCRIDFRKVSSALSKIGL